MDRCVKMCATTTSTSFAYKAVKANKFGTKVKRIALKVKSTTNENDDMGSHARVIVIVPGFLASADAYAEMCSALRLKLEKRGGLKVDARVVPVTKVDWWPTLFGKDFSSITDKIDASIREASSVSRTGRVGVVGHSAGGWLVRLWMGEKRYCGRRYSGAHMVDTLLTLGTPHASAEAYPFGRVVEKRENEDNEGVPKEARGSSLAFTNFHYPGAFFDSTRYVNVVGDVDPEGADSFDLSDVLDAKKSSRDGESVMDRVSRAYRAWIFGVSYAANCRSARVRGDGVTPITTAHALDGAEEIVLRGVYHGNAQGSPWYGSPEIVDDWIRFL